MIDDPIKNRTHIEVLKNILEPKDGSNLEKIMAISNESGYPIEHLVIRKKTDPENSIWYPVVEVHPMSKTVTIQESSNCWNTIDNTLITEFSVRDYSENLFYCGSTLYSAFQMGSDGIPDWFINMLNTGRVCLFSLKRSLYPNMSPFEDPGDTIGLIKGINRNVRIERGYWAILNFEYLDNSADHIPDMLIYSDDKFNSDPKMIAISNRKDAK